MVDGRERHERAVLTQLAKQGCCMRCRKTAERENVEETVFQNGRAASRGTCQNCGTAVFRTGEGSTETQTVLAAAAKGRLAA